MSRGSALYDRARRRIPGGAQLLSKQPERFLPDGWPAYYRWARGVEVEDLDGRRYVDVSIHAVGACPLGYADPDVDAAVIEAIRAGSTSTLNAPEEVELAELLCELHPWAEMARFTRAGGEAMSVAVRIARAASGRERVAFSGYHGWHDWYLAANLGDPHALDAHLLPEVRVAGVPAALLGTAIPFDARDPASIESVMREHGESLAAIVLEPAHRSVPSAGELAPLRDWATRLGAVLVFDEITSGFRMAPGGVHLEIGVEPDLVVFAKAMSNGYPMGAVLGRREVMEVAADGFISSSAWSERVGPVAALATIRKIREERVPEHLVATGQRMREGWEGLAGAHGLEIETRGLPPIPTFRFGPPDRTDAMATLYTRCMLDAGFLASNAFYASYAHRPEHVKAALEASDRAFGRVRSALDRDALPGAVARSSPGRRRV
jgi:glutamate-1-semialdehyde aminotransferase